MIEIKNISMRYGPTVALDDVSFDVNEGEILGLLGPNGAGKSTLMKILTTFICPTKGTAKVGGHDILEEPLKVREFVGYLPENVPLYTDMRVDEYMAFVGEARKVKGENLRERFEWLRKACGITEVWKHEINELSKGYRQRVGLAQALVHDPKVLILDEPTSGLDPLQIIGIRSLIKGLAEKKTIIFSTHILQEVEAVAGRIVIINEGKIVSKGTKEEIAKDAKKYRTFVLKVRGGREDTEKALKGLRHAKDVIFTDDKEGFVTFEVKSSFEDSLLWEEIDALNKEKQWQVKSFTERTYDLEDMFISLLSQSAKKEPALNGGNHEES